MNGLTTSYLSDLLLIIEADFVFSEHRTSQLFYRFPKVLQGRSVSYHIMSGGSNCLNHLAAYSQNPIVKISFSRVSFETLTEPNCSVQRALLYIFKHRPSRRQQRPFRNYAWLWRSNSISWSLGTFSKDCFLSATCQHNPKWIRICVNNIHNCCSQTPVQDSRCQPDPGLAQCHNSS